MGCVQCLIRVPGQVVLDRFHIYEYAVYQDLATAILNFSLTNAIFAE
jgi:hypothetical protein